jgi:hypothetical protein
MTGKQFVVLSLVLPFVALSSAIHADAATAKTRHWAITSFSSSSPVQSEPEAGSGYRHKARATLSLMGSRGPELPLDPAWSPPDTWQEA